MSVLLDASLLHAPLGDEKRTQYIHDLARCLTQHGYVRLTNHGIGDDTVHEAFSWCSRFFNLEPEIKARVRNEPGPNPQRGYSGPGAESAATLYGRLMNRDIKSNLHDAREHFDTGSPDDEEFPNKYPTEEELPGLKRFMSDFYCQCERVSFDILAALEEALGLASGTFQSRCSSERASELRFNQYPEISLGEMRTGDVRRIWPHFDLGIITMLFADDVGGLEFQDRTRLEDGEVFVPVQDGSQTDIIVNISETMQRWTHDVLPASLHQVTIPMGMREQCNGSIPTRHSIAYFVKADRAASVGAVPKFVPAGEQSKYEDMTALQYQQQRLKAAY